MPFLTKLAHWCREVTDDVDEWPGWQTRGRSGGQPFAPGRPWCVMYHHTASGDQSLEQYHASGSPNAPVCNLDIASNGRVIVIAAGPTNTNGKGRDLRTSKGTVPADSMNSYALGIEFYNNGTGMPWPQRQIDVGFAVIANIQRHLGLQPTDLFTHHEYAPTRKVDPATALAVVGPWQPRPTTTSGTWNDDDLRAENAARYGGDAPEPEPEPEEDDMLMLAKGSDGSNWVIGSELTRLAVWPDDWNAMLNAKVAVEVNLRGDTVDRIPQAGQTDVIGDQAGGV